jgi:hypothetical protein
MQQLAQAWLVLEISHSARLLGLDAFLANIPIFLFSLVGGVVADHEPAPSAARVAICSR